MSLRFLKKSEASQTESSVQGFEASALRGLAERGALPGVLHIRRFKRRTWGLTVQTRSA